MVDQCQYRRVRIKSNDGLQLRAAAALSFIASYYPGKLRVKFKHRQADAKSIIELLCLAAGDSDEIILEALGPKSAEALDRLEHLIQNGFDVNA